MPMELEAKRENLCFGTLSEVSKKGREKNRNEL